MKIYPEVDRGGVLIRNTILIFQHLLGIHCPLAITIFFIDLLYHRHLYCILYLCIPCQYIAYYVAHVLSIPNGLNLLIHIHTILPKHLFKWFLYLVFIICSIVVSFF